VFRDPYQVLGLRDLPDPDDPMSEEVRELFGIVDGQHTVAEIVESASLTEYEAYEAIHQMLESGWIEFVGRRDPGLPSLSIEPPPTPAGRHPVRWHHEALAALAVAALAFGAHFAAGSLPRARANDQAHDIFVAARVQNIELVLDLYALERGRYPRTLEELVEDRWIAAGQLRTPGQMLRYQPDPDGGSYRLALQPAAAAHP
jgi:hypothetical protein